LRHERRASSHIGAGGRGSIAVLVLFLFERLLLLLFERL
jgi:hypothetical protein